MGVYGGPHEVTSGLVGYWDAGNTKSYPGSGSTWYDLSGSKKNGTITSSSWSSSSGGYFQHDGTTNRSTAITYSTALYDWWTTDFTIDAWIYPTSYTGWYNSSPNIPTLVGNMSPTNISDYWSFGINSTGYIMFYYYTTTQNYVTSANLNVSLNTWSYITMTKTSSGIRLYYNNTTDGVTTAISGTPTSFATYNLTIAGYYNSKPTGNIASIKIYKGKALALSEVAQNFNALRGRFGI